MKKGFTLVEVSVSFFLLAMVWLAAIEVIVVSKYVAASSKNRYQAVYLAQKTLEEQRRLPFLNIQNYSTGSAFGLFTLDNSCSPMALTITVANIDGYRKRVQVKITWMEHFYGHSIPAVEYCTTDIANEPNLN